MTPTAQLIATVFSIVASYGAFAAWMLRHMDRRFDEAKADTQRQFEGMQRQFDGIQEQFEGVQRQFDGIQEQFEGVQRQFDGIQEQFEGVQRQFDVMQGRFDGIQEQFEGMQRQFDGVQGQFEGMQRQFDGVQGQFEGIQRQFAEFRVEMRQGFEQAREDRVRLERKIDVQGERIVTLHQVVGRLQGIVERTHEPERFTVRPAVPELSAGGEIREPRESYPAGPGGEEAGRDSGEGESGRADSAPAGEGTGRGDRS